MSSTKKSDTRLHFKKTEKGGKCKYCFIEVKTLGNTTNLRSHLLRKHPTIYSVSKETNTSGAGVSANSSSVSNVGGARDSSCGKRNVRIDCVCIFFLVVFTFAVYAFFSEYVVLVLIFSYQ